MVQQNSAWWVYLLECADGTLYCGCSNDVTQRVATHNAGNGAKYTRSRLPVKLVYQEKLLDRSCAQQREAQIKKLSREQKEKLITGENFSAPKIFSARRSAIQRDSSIRRNKG